MYNIHLDDDLPQSGGVLDRARADALRRQQLALKYRERKISTDEEWEFKSRHPEAWAKEYEYRQEADKAAALATLISVCTAEPNGVSAAALQHRTNRLLAAILLKLNEAK